MYNHLAQASLSASQFVLLIGTRHSIQFFSGSTCIVKLQFWLLFHLLRFHKPHHRFSAYFARIFMNLNSIHYITCILVAVHYIKVTNCLLWPWLFFHLVTFPKYMMIISILTIYHYKSKTKI
jgi:hypothetical protein